MSHERGYRLLTGLLVAPLMLVSGYYRRRAAREGGRIAGSRRAGLLWLLRAIYIPFFLLIAVYLVRPAAVAWARFYLPGWLRQAGALAGFATLPGFLSVLRALGTNITATSATREESHLVTTGPYRFVRHPMYSLGVVYMAGLIALTGLWPLIPAAVASYVIILYRTPTEEGELITRFGDDYRAYMARTGRYWPRLRRAS
jgi:protein-S-isoprenylcysteine O-methyltransferase Ste14